MVDYACAILNSAHARTCFLQDLRKLLYHLSRSPWSNFRGSGSETNLGAGSLVFTWRAPTSERVGSGAESGAESRLAARNLTYALHATGGY